MKLNIATLSLLVVIFGSCAKGQVTTDITMKLTQMEATIGSLTNKVQELENKQIAVMTQLNECKARDEANQNKQASWQDSHTKLLTIALNKLNKYGTRLDALEKQVINSELQILNLENTDKNLSSILQIYRSFANQKFSNISHFSAKQLDSQHQFAKLETNLTSTIETHATQSKQHFDEIMAIHVNLKQTVDDHSSKLGTLLLDNANMKSEQSLLETNLKNIGVKQQNLEYQNANQLSSYGKRMDVLEKQATKSQLQISNLENTNKGLSSMLQNLVTLSNQTFSELSLKHGNLAKSINNQNSTLTNLQDSDVTIKTKQYLLGRQIQNTENKQNILNQKITSQASELLKLERTATRNIKQISWNTESTLDSTSIQKLKFSKKSKNSGLWLSFYGVLKVSGGLRQQQCNRWWFELNGVECSNPTKVESVIYLRGADEYYSPSVVSGICYGIPAGDVQIDFKVGGCNCGFFTCPPSDASTGFGNVASHLIIEEIRN